MVTLNDANDPNAVCLEVMRLLNAMCEGVHSRNQALLRSQPQNAMSTNFIHRAVDVLNVLQNKLHELPGPRCDDDQAALDAYEATLSKGMVTVFRLLNEVVQGPCRENQLAMLVGCPLLLLSNRVLHYTLYDPQHIELADMEGASTLKCNLLSLLCGLLEGNRPGDEEIPTRIIDILNTKLLDRQVRHRKRPLCPCNTTLHLPWCACLWNRCLPQAVVTSFGKFSKPENPYICR